MNAFRRIALGLAVLICATFISGRLLRAAAPMDDREKAVSVLEQAVKTNPDNSEIWVHLGFAYRKADKINQARDAFEKATSLNPQATEALFMLGLIYESQHNDQAAIKAWQRYLAAEKDPEKRTMAEKHLHVLGQ